jgi:hypothetical protein
MPITVIATSGLAYWGMLRHAHTETLPNAGAFEAVGGRSWLVPFWELEGKWVGVAFPQVALSPFLLEGS